jgi:iron complex transport system substrate-binding protein
MMRKNIIAQIFLAVIFLSGICNIVFCFPVKVIDGLGREVIVKAPPQRIVSTVPSNTEILYDLDLKDKVIAVTSHCKKTCDISGKSVIGGWSDPEIIEKIADLRPDLVISFGGLQSPLAAQMDKRNISAFVFFPETVEETLKQVLLVGEITGTAPKAKDIVGKCRRRLTRIENKFKNIPLENRSKCLRLMSTEARVIGGLSFQNDIIKKAGGINIFEDIKEYYPVVSLEDVKKRDPDIIIFNRNDERKAIEWFLKQNGWRDLRAAGEGRLMSISCDYICHANTRIDKTVEMLARRFYPGKF